MSEEPQLCPGCYDSFSGPWCDNCDQWPCICLIEKNPPEPEKEPQDAG